MDFYGITLIYTKEYLSLVFVLVVSEAPIKLRAGEPFLKRIAECIFLRQLCSALPVLCHNMNLCNLYLATS